MKNNNSNERDEWKVQIKCDSIWPLTMNPFPTLLSARKMCAFERYFSCVKFGRMLSNRIRVYAVWKPIKHTTYTRARVETLRTQSHIHTLHTRERKNEKKTTTTKRKLIPFHSGCMLHAHNIIHSQSHTHTRSYTLNDENLICCSALCASIEMQFVHVNEWRI